MPSPHAIEDQIERVLDYDMIIATIKDILAEGHINLVETLAEGVARHLRQDQEASEGAAHHEQAAQLLATTARESISPLDRLETALHPWVAFGIMPLFALANAGVAVDRSALGSPVALAVAAGLVLGKPLGIVTFSWIAVRVGLAFPGPIHLLVTDLVMPKAGGREVAERLGPSRPEARVLFLSGYTDDALVRHGVLEAGVAFLQKPFTPTTLARKVREVLNAEAAVHLHLGTVVHPRHAEHDHALGLDQPLEQLGRAVLGVPVEHQRERVHHFGDRLVELDFVRVLGLDERHEAAHVVLRGPGLRRMRRVQHRHGPAPFQTGTGCDRQNLERHGRATALGPRPA